MSRKLPVTLVFYRRPDQLRGVLQAVRAYRPETIFAVSDGAKPKDSEIEARVRECRTLLHNGIDWPCQVERIYADTNLGLRGRVESGLTQVFQKTDFSVILEEDCVPLPEFFSFVEEIRARWENEEQIGAISGNCFLPASFRPAESYFFSRYPHIWGWATWARCWQKHDAGDGVWPFQGGVGSFWPDMPKREKVYWEQIFNRVYRHELETWDYRWLLSFWRNHWLAITPRENLVQNTGFGEEATNTQDPTVNPGVERTSRLSFPLSHPKEIKRIQEADEAVFRNHYLRMEGRLSFWPRLMRSLRKKLTI